MKHVIPLFVCAFLFGLATAVWAQPTIDGTLDAAYGPALTTQDTNTGFGDSNLGVVDNANGSELDLGYGGIAGGYLYLFLAGNLESNFNKLEIFLDTVPGGENRLLGTNSNQGGFLRMCDDGSGNGFTFDTGFEADYWVSITCGGSPFALYADYVEIGTGVGYYLGQGAAATPGALTGGTAPFATEATIDNSNVGGVGGGGCPPGTGSGAGVTTGVELKIPVSAIGNPTGCIQVCAFVNGTNHDYVSNQFLGPATDACNLAEPRTVDLNQYPGDQYFMVCDLPVPVEPATWGKIKSMY
jgi:hypothetical protein